MHCDTTLFEIYNALGVQDIMHNSNLADEFISEILHESKQISSEF
jgi:hypothetical protein